MVPNSCIFYLVNEQEIHVKRLEDSLQCLKDNFLQQYSYPVVFGHEGLADTTIDRIRASAPENHYFHKVDFNLPKYSEDIIEKIPEKFKGEWDENAFFSMGYRHMCRYFSGAIYKDKFFENVEYMLRIDCDSYFIDKVDYDIFKYVADNNIIYSSVAERENEADYVIVGLKQFLEKYFDDNYEMPSVNKTFDTHFELVNFKWFKEEPYINYFNEIDKTGSIFINRWGDAPLKYQGVKYMLSEDKIHMFNLPYKHGGDYHAV